MKKLPTLAAIAAIAIVPFIGGCSTAVGVDNTDDSTGQYQFGTLTSRYESRGETYFDTVFNASNKAIDDLGYMRVYQTPGKTSTVIAARAVGDDSVTVTLSKKAVKDKDGITKEWIQVEVHYGTWGDLKASQQIISTISKNLR